MTRAGLISVFMALGLALFWIVPVADAQVGPAGNAHPESHALSVDDPEAEGVAFPFGRPSPTETTVEEKLAFARELDLDLIRGLAVQHNGRVKVLDTLARETVSSLTGKKRYRELTVPEGVQFEPLPEGVRDEDLRYTGRMGELETVSLDPVFTMLDVMIDPGYYVGRPMISVDFLPLRRSLLEDAYPGDAQAQERLLKYGTVAPGVIDQHMQAVADRHGGDPAWRAAMLDTDSGMELFWFGSANLLMVPPDSASEEWIHLAQGPPEVREAAMNLGDAWRSLDAERTNEALSGLNKMLRIASTETYPSHTRCSLEVAYNQASPFEWGSWAYLFAFLLFVLAFGIGRRWMKTAGLAMFLLALSLHAFGFIARCVIAERFAIQNQYESMTGVSLFAALVGLALMIGRKQWLFGAAAAGAGFLVLITATQTAIPGSSIGREAAILNTSVLLKYHVTTVLTSYGLITLGFVVSLFYLATHYGAKYFGRSEAEAVAAGALGSTDSSLSPVGERAGVRGSDSTPPTLARTLKDLDTAQLIILQLAFWTLAVGILLGAWWADHSWGRWWAFDPKETWALVTWIIYLIVIHVRAAGVRDKGRVTAWLSVVGFIVMLWTYLGVNLLLPGLHAYA